MTFDELFTNESIIKTSNPSSKIFKHMWLPIKPKPPVARIIDN